MRSCPQRDFINSAAAERHPLGCNPTLMRHSIVMLALAFTPVQAASQATSVEEPPVSVRQVLRFMKLLDGVGDLTEESLPDSAIELRFWSIGWSMTGLRLRRSATGEWTAQQIVVDGMRARFDAVLRTPSAALDSIWNELIADGLLTLPTHVPRTWGRADGHSYSIELRRGSSYRAMRIEHLDKPEVSADAAIKRIAGILKGRFPFMGGPVR